MSTITRDVLAVPAVAEAVNNAGASVQGGFQKAADALSDTSLIGEDIAGALESAGGSSGGNVIELALTGDAAIHRLGLALGWLTFLIPTMILLLRYVPTRVGQTRRLRACRLVYPRW